MGEITLSIITPVYRGENTLEDLVIEIEKEKNKFEENNAPLRLVEVIFVDDGSRDNSNKILKKLEKKYDWVLVVGLSKNYGQHPATMAGILHSSGDWIATLDEDLQHHPKYLTQLLEEAVLKKKDIIYAHPDSPVHRSVIRDNGSKFYKWVISKISGNSNVRKFNSYRMMRGSIARATAAVSINQTYFDLALSWFTDRVGVISLPMIDYRYQENKSSGYSLHSLLSHARRMFLSSNFKILRTGAIFGFVAMSIAVIVAIYTLTIKVYYPETASTPGWASIMVSILFLGGMNAMLSGLVLEYLSMIILQIHGKPTFFEVDRSLDERLIEWFQKHS